MYIFRQTPHFYPPLLLYRPVPFCGIKFGQPSAPDPSSPKSSQKTTRVVSTLLWTTANGIRQECRKQRCLAFCESDHGMGISLKHIKHGDLTMKNWIGRPSNIPAFEALETWIFGMENRGKTWQRMQPAEDCFVAIGQSIIFTVMSYGHLPVISTYNPIYRMYNPIYNQL